ncbi:acyl-CoA dehydrogenase family protein [Paraburkholderia acidicola]|uniref:Acyl-CoA dehydrogenase family protein n=1 Tax=Paraburkholderia acidicola TaxID=1912599 RepID=A0ABV1LYQ9_9BURK
MHSFTHGDDLSTRRHLLAVADQMAEGLQTANAAIEAQRHLPQKIAQSLADAGLYRMFTPRHLGGHEVDVHTFVLVIERLARADASAAWCTFISCTSAIIAGYLPEAEAQLIFHKPDLKLAGVFAPRGRARPLVRDGVAGYLVSGSWPWGSGSRNADYVSGGCLVMDAAGKPELLADGTPNVRSMLFDATEVEFTDNWHVMGLRGTGSNEFAVHEVFVPATRSVALMSDVPLPKPLYKFPVFGLLGVGIASVALGVARLAIDSLVELATEKTPQGSSRLLADRASTQEHVARSEARLRAARAYLLDAVDAAWEASLQPGPISIDLRRDIRLSTTFATEEAAAVVDRMHRMAGGSAVYESSPLQRCLRDVHVATQHIMVSESTYEVAGRLFLRLPTNISMI